jgi:hypothetical protein
MYYYGNYSYLLQEKTEALTIVFGGSQLFLFLQDEHSFSTRVMIL